MRIGVVEDDPLISGLLSEILERLGHHATMYHDGWAFLGELTIDQDRNPFDKVIIDVLLPGSISGIEVINYLRITRPQLPIVVISAIDSEDLQSVQRQFPGVQILHKPFHIHELRVCIES